jgi:hypothetical protein
VTPTVTEAVILSWLPLPTIPAFRFSGYPKALKNPGIIPILEPEYKKIGTGTPEIPACPSFQRHGCANPISRVFRHG